MYLLKAKKQFESEDEKELQQKRENYKQRQKKARQIQPGGRTSSILFGTSDPHRSLSVNIDDLPDGSCFAHKNSTVPSGTDVKDDTELRPAGYIGTFSVQSSNAVERTEFVQTQLKQMQKSKFHKKVQIGISISGVKVYSADGQTLIMAHALRRISYATCDPDNHQFSFLAREPQGKVNIQFCHAFITAHPHMAEELSTLLGNAFKVAHIDQRQASMPSFNDVIKKQLDDQKATFKEYQVKAEQTLQKNLKAISTPTTYCEKAMERIEAKKAMRPEDRSAVNSKFTAFKQAAERKSLVRRSSGSKSTFQSPFRSCKDFTEIPQTGGPLMSAVRRNSQSLSSAVRTSLGNMNNNRVRGSPVVALKDTIDQQFESHLLENEYNNKYKSGYKNCAPCDGTDATYLTPVCNHDDTHDPGECVHRTEPVEPSAPPQQDVCDASQIVTAPTNMANRPLPAIPMDTERPLRIPPRQRQSLQITSDTSSALSYLPPSNEALKKPLSDLRRSVQSQRNSTPCGFVAQQPYTREAGYPHHIVSHTRSVDAVPILWTRQGHRAGEADDDARGSRDVIRRSEFVRKSIDFSTMDFAKTKVSATDATKPDGQARDVLTSTSNDAESYSDIIGTGQFDNVPPHHWKSMSSASESSTDPCDIDASINNASIATPDLIQSSSQSDESLSQPDDECIHLAPDDEPHPETRPDNSKDVFDPYSYQITDPPLYTFDDLGYPDPMHGNVSQQRRAVRPKSYPSSDLPEQSDEVCGARDVACHETVRYQNDSDGTESDDPNLSPDRLSSLRNLGRSYIEDESLRQCAWYQPGIPRDVALEMLQQEDNGCFIVRDSSTHRGCYALSVNVPKYNNPCGIAHYLIVKSEGGVKLKGVNKDWTSLQALVTHHTVMREMLPCTLRLPHTTHNPSYNPSDRRGDVDDDPDYQRPSDLESLVASLHTT